MLILALAFTVPVQAKCPTGTVTVHGRVENLPSAVTVMEVTVLVESPKGTVSRTAPVSNEEFTVEVPFSTLSSSTLLLGDRCNNSPKLVEVKIVSAGKVYVQKRLAFKGSFEMSGPNQYRLKQELALDVSKEGTGGTTP